jgi:hypothetical protein
MSINKQFSDIVHNSLGDVDEKCDDKEQDGNEEF